MIIRDLQLTKNFKLSEFMCKDDANEIVLEITLVNELQKLRDLIKKPIYIVSGYRTKKFNTLIGAAKNSQHVFGKAVDIHVKDMSPEEVVYIARFFKFGGIGLYDTWTHLDIRLENVFWDKRMNKNDLIITL